MKKTFQLAVFVIALLLIFMSGRMCGQSAAYITSSTQQSVPGQALGSMSAANAWLNSGLSYQLFGDDNFENSFAFNTRIIRNISAGKVNIPIAGNFQLGTGDSPDIIDLAVLPWGEITSSEDGKFRLIGHGRAEYSITPVEGDDIQGALFAAGLEAFFLTGQASRPASLSVTPLYAIPDLNFDGEIGVEITGVFPLGNGLGLMGEWNSATKIFNLAVITALNL